MRWLSSVFRAIAFALSVPVIWFLMPLKLFAWRTRHRWLRRIVLEFTTLADFLMVFANVQNQAIRLHYNIWGGNFLFGKALMVVDSARAEREIVKPTMRGNRFMGVDIVSNDPGAFVTNAGPICSGQPVRRLHREYIDSEVMTERVRAFDLESLTKECAPILDEWSASADMTSAWKIRGAVTRLFLFILAKKTLPKNEVDAVTKNYARRFAEFSFFARYLPSMLGFLGTRESIRRDSYIPLQRAGIDNVVIDMTLFAAMFSIGTIVMKCVEYTSKYAIDYRSLNPRERAQFVIESLRHYPTVTTVHRIVEEEETIEVHGKPVALLPGDEVAYPFYAINRDPRRFVNPDEFDYGRSREELEAVLSWSVGPHVCPAKDLSILAVVMMLDTLSKRYDLRRLRIFSPEF